MNLTPRLGTDINSNNDPRYPTTPMMLMAAHVRQLGLIAVLFGFPQLIQSALAQTETSKGGAAQIWIAELDGKEVDLLPAGATNWVRTTTNQILHVGDRLRSGGSTRGA